MADFSNQPEKFQRSTDQEVNKKLDEKQDSSSDNRAPDNKPSIEFSAEIKTSTYDDMMDASDARDKLKDEIMKERNL